MDRFSKGEILGRVGVFLGEHPEGVVVVLGSTGSGKTGFSVELCQFISAKLGRKAEVLSVDSRQVYRELDISAAKATEEEMAGVPHWGLDLCNPDEKMTAYGFQQYGFGVINDMQERGVVPVLAGGTMLWLDAITQNYEFAERGEKSTQKGAPKWPVLQVGLAWERAELYARLDARAVTQWQGGMVGEVQNLLKKYPNMVQSVGTSFGVGEVQRFLAGEVTQAEAMAANQQRNRNYAKRQLTWWRGREDIIWLDGETL